MDGFVVMVVVADAIAAKGRIVRQFNEYVHRTMDTPSFVHGREGYFRLPCSVESCSSVGIAEFGKFLQSIGCMVTGISSKGEQGGAEISFAMGGKEAHVLVSTVGVY
ncbi:MAG: hypothetical protein WC861_05335 [Candidatus Micrarchaeia archaeon]|jgi:hypothetical protein